MDRHVGKSIPFRTALEGSVQAIASLLAFILLAASGLSAGFCQERAESSHDQASVAVKGKYVNTNYGYAVRIPDDRQAYRPAPPAPQHGVRLQLTKDYENEMY